MGICGKKAAKKIEQAFVPPEKNGEKCVRVSGDSSQETAAAAALTSVPPLLSNRSKQQRWSRQLEAARGSIRRGTKPTQHLHRQQQSRRFFSFRFGTAFSGAFFSSCAFAACYCAQRARTGTLARPAPRAPGARHLNHGGLTPRRHRRCCCCLCCYRGVVELI